MSFVELLTENRDNRYSLRQIQSDPDAKTFFHVSFGCNYGALRVDSRPLVRGFIPEGPFSDNDTLYEVMPIKREIHVIPNPKRSLFYEEIKVKARNTFLFWGTLDDVLGEFNQAGFSLKEFPPEFDCLTNFSNGQRYYGEEGFPPLRADTT